MNRWIPIYLCALAALGTTACTNPSRIHIPETLKPAANETLALVVPAKGVQVYECRAMKDVVPGYEWAFVAPDATLYDANGAVIGHHGAGPYWEASDGSRIVGTVKTRANAPSAGDIPWLLLATRSTGREGSFSKVTSIQRVNTEGGKAPSAPCMANLVGKQVQVKYTADYRLFVAN